MAQLGSMSPLMLTKLGSGRANRQTSSGQETRCSLKMPRLSSPAPSRGSEEEPSLVSGLRPAQDSGCIVRRCKLPL